MKCVTDDFVESEYGKELIGENFLVFKEVESKRVCSFILTGGVGGDYVYKCIWNEFF